MILEERLKRALTLRKDDVFVRAELARYGSQAQVSRALRQLVATGILIKLGVGVYAKAKKSVLSGQNIPVKPVEILAQQALEKLGVTVYPSQLTAAYNNATSTQLPAGIVVNTGTRRIQRKIAFGNQALSYEKNKQRSGRDH